MVSIDLQKVFGTIQHNLFLQKVAALGFSNELTNWFRLYLSSKKSQQNIHDKFSKSAHLRRGLLQVSTLGIFIIFSIYWKHAKGWDCDLFLYLDNTSLLY